jgi:type I restriction enzyme M protein
LSTTTSGEGEIRKNIVNADLVDAIIALPDKLFYTTGIPVCIWIINRNKKNPGKTLFIDARKFGQLVTRKLRELTDEDIRKIADTYINWQNNEKYEDIQGFCKSAPLEEIRQHDYNLTPGRYVGIEEEEVDGEPFEEKMERLTTTLAKQFKKSRELEEEIRKQLEKIGFEF